MELNFHLRLLFPEGLTGQDAALPAVKVGR